MNILVTGSNGFVGKNLIETLKNIKYKKDNRHELIVNDIYEFDISNEVENLDEYTKKCDIVINLAGVNRPKRPEDFYKGNRGFIEILCYYLEKNSNKCPVIVSSSIQAEEQNDYGRSKKEGEEYILSFGESNGNKIYIYRFTNLFGKWCRPNYNSVVATWCYNIARNKEISINDTNKTITLCYIDDVVDEIILCAEGKKHSNANYYEVQEQYNVSLGELAETLNKFYRNRLSLQLPNQAGEFEKKLYATYLSYLPCDKLSYSLKMNKDERGSFTEFLKMNNLGQISINISHPGIKKGNHWHHTKNEKFLVVSGRGLIQLRKIGEKDIISYQVSGEELKVIDIPTGYTHCIENLGKDDMVTVMWANETFNPDKPDTYYEEI